MRPLLLEEYLRFRKDPVNDETTDGMWCGTRRIRPEDLTRLKAAHPDWAQEVLDHRRKQYAEQLKDVDTALIEKAKSGNTQAAELLYRRFENWTPKAAEDALKRNPTNKTFAELIAEGEG
jgi:hypothetical protein